MNYKDDLKALAIVLVVVLAIVGFWWFAYEGWPLLRAILTGGSPNIGRPGM